MPDRVSIAGAGISGLSAAIQLAQHGWDVHVFEMKNRVASGAGHHTEGIRNYLGRDGLEEIRSWGFRVEPFSLATRVVRKSPSFVSTVRGVSYYLVERGGRPNSLEAQLYRQAVHLGVTFHFKEPADLERTEIIATGAPVGRVNIVAAGFRFSKQGSHLGPDTIYAVFDNEYAPHGYLCVLPGSTDNSVYAVSWSDLRFASLLRRVERARELPMLSEVLGTARRLGGIYGRGYVAADPISLAKMTDHLFVGEAAGFQDALGGFGIRYALLTGMLAANAIAEGRDYQELLRREFGDEFKIAAQQREMLKRANNEVYDKMLQGLGRETFVNEYESWRRIRFM